jgi:hypothetical protein
MPGLQIYTGTYQKFEHRQGVPIRTTVGAPRFALGYPIAGHWKTVTPDRAMLSADLTEAAFRDAYQAKLDRVGFDAIMAEAEAFTAAHGDNRLVCLCFDDLTKPGNWCHRSMLGAWLTDRGVPVIELCPRRPRATLAAAPPRLF